MERCAHGWSWRLRAGASGEPVHSIGYSQVTSPGLFAREGLPAALAALQSFPHGHARSGVEWECRRSWNQSRIAIHVRESDEFGNGAVETAELEEAANRPFSAERLFSKVFQVAGDGGCLVLQSRTRSQLSTVEVASNQPTGMSHES